MKREILLEYLFLQIKQAGFGTDGGNDAGDHTDGGELDDQAGEIYGPERVVAAIETSRSQNLEESVHSVVTGARNWHEDRALGDDLTLLGMQIF